MQLLIVRHADAGDAEEFAKTGAPDSMRPLSSKGRKQIRTAAKALLQLVPDVGLIATSPYLRAAETHDALRAVYGKSVESATTDTLEPERSPEAFAKWLRARREDVIAAVGHEPHLSTLVTWLMSGGDDSRIQLKKGGACLLDFEDRAAKDSATLRWLLTPKHLDALASE
jgi:phosphohistidine phosphatase